MTPVVCDALALVAVLLDSGPDGEWATQALGTTWISAPDLLPYETANIIRRQQLSGAVSADQAAQAHRDLLDLVVELWPYEATAMRAWELRENLTVYDASYVAVAEELDVPLITLDARIARSPGLRCEVLTPAGPTPRRG